MCDDSATPIYDALLDELLIDPDRVAEEVTALLTQWREAASGG